MKYNFSEKILGANFREDIVTQVRLLINAGTSFSVLSMPFIGVSVFFRYLATTNLAYFAYLDVQSLQKRKKEELFLLLYKELGGKNKDVAVLNAFEVCKRQLCNLLKAKKRIVILLVRIEYLKEEFSNGLFENLKSLEELGKGQIVFVIALNKPLYEINEIATYESNPSFLSKVVYFSPYPLVDLQKILLLIPPGLRFSAKDIRDIMVLCGGHPNLLQLLLKTDNIQNPLEDPYIRLHLKGIYEAYNQQQKNQMRKLASGRSVRTLDPYLLKIGIIEKEGSEYKLFSPLFRDYLTSYVQIKLAKKERKLFYLLKKRLGKFVEKDEIFNSLWEKDSPHSTDWALNALIYRLRKNPTFMNNRYVIENEKGQGYRLIKG